MQKAALCLAAVAMSLSGCAAFERFRKVPDSNPAPGISAAPDAIAPPIETTTLPGGGGAQSAEALDQTTEAERAAATAAPVSGAERELGKIVVALGTVTEQGIWLKSELVSEPGKGRVVTASGASVAVDLLPGSGGATLSLAAYRALNLGLTDLPEVTVFAN